MLCVLISYIRGGTYSLKSTTNDRFFWETFHGNFIYSQSFCQKSAERKSPKKYFSYLFWCLAWGWNPGFSSNKPTRLISLPSRPRWLQLRLCLTKKTDRIALWRPLQDSNLHHLKYSTETKKLSFEEISWGLCNEGIKTFQLHMLSEFLGSYQRYV